MAFTLFWLPEARAQYDQLRARAQASLENRRKRKRLKSTADEGLFKQVHKCLVLLGQNPRHLGLQTHEFHSLSHPFHAGEKVFEAYAQNRTSGAYRIFWCYGPAPQQITIIAITPHP